MNCGSLGPHEPFLLLPPPLLPRGVSCPKSSARVSRVRRRVARPLGPSDYGRELQARGSERRKGAARSREESLRGGSGRLHYQPGCTGAFPAWLTHSQPPPRPAERRPHAHPRQRQSVPIPLLLLLPRSGPGLPRESPRAPPLPGSP